MSGINIVALGDWIKANIWLFLLFAFIAFIFFLFQKDGFAIKWMELKVRERELDSKQLDDARVLADIFMRRYDRPDPLLPFDSDLSDQQK